MSTTKTKTDVYETVTSTIIEALEAGVTGDSWRAPWHSTGVFELPTNIASKKEYRGINTWVLVSEQFIKGYEHPVWGTYKQWRTAGAQVRGGEHGTTVIIWKPTKRKVKNSNGEDELKNSLFARAFKVFNADQVDGYEFPVLEEPENPFEAIEHAEAFFTEVGADVTHGGNRAYYTPAADRIQLPPKDSFNTNVDYYATSAHEHVHWTGNDKRCNRELDTTRFGNEAYAFEELIAELGAAYTCGILGLTNEPREDHAQYLASWLKVFKSDPKAIVTASSKAQRAVDYLLQEAGEKDTEEELEEVSA